MSDPRENASFYRWILGIVSSLLITGIVGISAFLFNMNGIIQSIDSSQEEINKGILLRLENIERSFSTYANAQELRIEDINKRIDQNAQNLRTSPEIQNDIAKDLKNIELMIENSNTRMQLWVLQQLEKPKPGG